MPDTPSMSFLEPEFAPHYEAWKQSPDPVNSGKLLKAAEPVLNTALRTYVGTAPSPTMRSRAKVMALRAAETYDPGRAKFRTHLLTQLQGLRRHAAKETAAISIPEQVALDIGHLREAENRLRDKLGRDPSDMELSDHVGLSKRRLAYLRQHRPSRSEGSMQRPTEDGEDIFLPAVEEGGVPPALLEFVYNDADPADQVILEHSLGLHGKPVLQNQQIARKLRLSPGAISQRKAKLQKQIQLVEDVKLFG